MSHNRIIVPILVATEAAKKNSILNAHVDDVFDPIYANKNNLNSILLNIISG